MKYIINSAEDREVLKKQLELDREAGKVADAKAGFEAIAKWDLENNNIRGYINILGHISICVKQEIEKASDVEQKKLLSSELLELTSTIVEKSKETNMPQGTIAISQVHQASAFLENSIYNSPEARNAQLQTALDIIDEAISVFPGSKAHLAWPLNTKAQILNAVGNSEEAMDTIMQGQKAIFIGYDDQMKEDDNSDLKLKIWLTGLYVTAARISKETGREYLAIFYANAVIAMPDPENHLVNRKDQARKILS